jgi:hypothetical protein
VLYFIYIEDIFSSSNNSENIKESPEDSDQKKFININNNFALKNFNSKTFKEILFSNKLKIINKVSIEKKKTEEDIETILEQLETLFQELEIYSSNATIPVIPEQKSIYFYDDNTRI